jgi:DNA-binding CsgD family transcriptional regulator
MIKVGAPGPTAEQAPVCYSTDNAHRHMVSFPLLDMLPFGVIVLDTKAKTLFTNAYASDLLHTGAELDAVDGFLRARSIPHSRALHSALERLAGEAAQEPIGFNIARAEQRPISIVLARLPSRSKGTTSGKCRIAVFLYDPELDHHASAPLVRDLFQFTPVESSIATLMMESLDTAAIARELAITRNTLRDHLKSMFSKTRTRNQGELIHTLLRCPAALRFRSPV